MDATEQRKRWSQLFGKNLSVVFSIYELNADDCADALNKDYTTIEKWINGNRYPNPKNFAKLKHYLKESIEIKTKNKREYFEVIYTHIKKNIESCGLKVSLKDLPKTNRMGTQELIFNAMTLCDVTIKDLDKKIRKKREENKSPEIRAVFFDFSLVLAPDVTSKSIWEGMWEAAGYKTIDCQCYVDKYNKGEMPYDNLCHCTFLHFAAKGFTYDIMREKARIIKLRAGTHEVLRTLKAKNIDVYIMSSAPRDVIREALGESYSCVHAIYANQFIYDKGNKLGDIVSIPNTPEDKKNYIRTAAQRLKIKPINILYIGKPKNAILAHETGTKALCINADKKRKSNTHQCDYYMGSLRDLNEVIPFITR